MLQYSVIIIVRHPKLRKGGQESLIAFLKQLIVFYTTTLAGVVIGGYRIVSRTFLAGKLRLNIARDPQHRGEEVIHFFFHVLLHPGKVELVHSYLKNQPTIERIHIFLS